MAGPASALILAESLQLGESLLILLRSIPGIGAIHQASDGPSALAMSIELEPTLVLLDYHMLQNGHSNTLGRMKARQPQAHFVVLVDDEDHFQRARAAGADLVLMKGVRAATLLESIEKLLE